MYRIQIDRFKYKYWITIERMNAMKISINNSLRIKWRSKTILEAENENSRLTSLNMKSYFLKGMSFSK